MAHIPNLKNIFELISKRLSSNGLFIFEVNSLYHMVINDVFDYIYHEHIFYHSITSLRNLLGLAKLFINEVNFVPTKGGSFRLVCSKNNFQNESVNYWKIKEASIGLHEDNPLIFKYLNNFIPFLKTGITRLIQQNKNKKIYLFGACATTTVLIETLGLANKVNGIIDDNVKRQNRFSPGRGIPVLPKSVLNSEDIVINTAWRHNKKIKESLKKTNLKEFILPIPYPKFEKL